MKFSDAFFTKHIVFDGGMGTMLLSAGLPAGASPDVWNITNPDAVRAVTPEQILAAAQHYLDPQRLIIVTAGPQPAADWSQGIC